MNPTSGGILFPKVSQTPQPRKPHIIDGSRTRWRCATSGDADDGLQQSCAFPQEGPRDVPADDGTLLKETYMTVQALANMVQTLHFEIEDKHQSLKRHVDDHFRYLPRFEPTADSIVPSKCVQSDFHPLPSLQASELSNSQPARPDEPNKQVATFVAVDDEKAEGQNSKEDESEDDAPTHGERFNPTMMTSVSEIKLMGTSSLASIFLSRDEEELDEPAYFVEDYYWQTGVCQAIARSPWFARVTSLAVVCNSLFMAVDSDRNTAENIYTADWGFQFCAQFFTVYFTVELLIRFFAFENKRSCLRDGWFKFDLFLVVTQILEIWVLATTMYLFPHVEIPRGMLMGLRLLKLTRMARLMHSFPELVIMVQGLLQSLRAISSTLVMIGLLTYIWAIMLHNLMKDEHEYNSHMWNKYWLGFSTIPITMSTLFFDGTLLLDNAGPLMIELLFEEKSNMMIAGILLLLYTVISAFCLMQMLVGVLCEVVNRVTEERHESKSIALVKEELLADLMEHCGDDGMISKQELFEVMSSKKSKAVLKKLNINRVFLLELQKMLFTKPGQQVSIKTCIRLLIMCRGDCPTTVELMASGLLSISQEITGLKQLLEADARALEREIKYCASADKGS